VFSQWDFSISDYNTCTTILTHSQTIVNLDLRIGVWPEKCCYE